MTSFSNVSQEEAEVIFGFRFDDFYNSQIPLNEFIKKKASEELKKKVFDRLIDWILSEGFPEATIAPMNESVVTDFIGIILATTVADIDRTKNRRDFIVLREKQIISKDEEFGGNMEFMIIQSICTGNVRHIIVIEAKRNALGKGLTQLLLALKSMFEVNNDQKLVYGFVTTAINWQLVTYDGQTWKLSRPSVLLLGNMEKYETEWLKDNTQILDVIYSILSLFY
ncbi:hypothetical protein I4U23_010738 [Adineta vaga]|nr:hypothetical protein I4U23_010738 [Adineta vaga]